MVCSVLAHETKNSYEPMFGLALWHFAGCGAREGDHGDQNSSKRTSEEMVHKITNPTALWHGERRFEDGREGFSRVIGGDGIGRLSIGVRTCVREVWCVRSRTLWLAVRRWSGIAIQHLYLGGHNSVREDEAKSLLSINQVSRILLVFGLSINPQTALGESQNPLVRGPVILDVGQGLSLQVEYIEAPDYPLLAKPSWIAAHAYFFTEGYPASDDPFLDANTVFGETKENEVRWMNDRFNTYKGWHLGPVPARECPENFDPVVCRAGPPLVPDVWAVIGYAPDGCRGPTLMTGFGQTVHVTRRRSPTHLDDVFTPVEPISDVRWVGKINRSSTLFIATLQSPYPVTAEERRRILAIFSVACGSR